MNLQSILNSFKTYDKNNDGILSHTELKACKGTIWEGFYNEGGKLMKNDFVVHGLLQEQDDYDEPKTSFEKMHEKLTKQGIKPVNYWTEEGPYKDYVIYSNGAYIYSKDVKSYDELPSFMTPNTKSAKGVDISNLKLSEEQLLSLIIDKYTVMSDEQKEIFEKAQKNCSQMGLGIEKVIENGYSGNNTMALLDQEYCGHKMYADKIVYTTNLNKFENDKSWHCAAMLSIMHKTAPDADIMHYCVTNHDRDTQDKQFADAIRDIINKNKSLPDDKKIKTIIMGWGFYEDSPKYDEYIQLCKEAVDSGIFIFSNNTKELYGVDLYCSDRNPLGDVHSPLNYKPANYMDINFSGISKEKKDSFLFLPTQHLTIANEDGISTQYEGLDGGACWANSVGALYNTFLSIKPDLTPRDFMKLIMETSDELTVDNLYCGRILNAERAMQTLKQNK